MNEIQTQLKNIDVKYREKVRLRVTKDGAKIYTNDNETHNMMKKCCVDNSWQGFTYTPKQDRYMKVCVYGLWQMPLDELKIELASKNIEPVLLK